MQQVVYIDFITRLLALFIFFFAFALIFGPPATYKSVTPGSALRNYSWWCMEGPHEMLGIELGLSVYKARAPPAVLLFQPLCSFFSNNF